MSTLYAQPYDIAATGFYFETAEQYTECSAKAVREYGQRVEEFEIQFIDGEALDAALFDALNPHQGNIAHYIQCENEWIETDKRNLIIAVGECGYSYDLGSSDPDAFDIDIYETDSLRELAKQFADEGLFGHIPDHLANYIDFEAIARDLSFDYVETTIAGDRLIFRSG